jgi:hypothetical protein
MDCLSPEAYLRRLIQPGSCGFYARIAARLPGCVILGLLLLLLPLSRAEGQQCNTDTGFNCPKPQPPQTPSEPRGTVIFVPPPMDSGCPFGSSRPEGDYEKRAEMLDKHGPQLPPIFSMSVFSIMGFAKGNWPVVIDYLLEQDSLLLVVVAPDGQKPQIFRLDGKKGHWQTKIQLPPEIGDQPRVSQYLVQTLDNNLGQVSPSHVHIHGIAAGNKAVGSIGIDQVSFSPASIRLDQHQHAQYSFHSMFDFKNTEVTFVRLAKSSTGEIIAASVGSKSMGSVNQNARKDGDWDGSVKPPAALKNYPPELQQWLKLPVGQHALQVRAWFGVKDGGDWVTALSETIVSVE